MNKETRISIKKLNKELFDHIIKVIPNAVALIIRKDSKMNKPPIWFQEFEKRNNKKWEQNNSRLNNIENKINLIEEKVDNNTKLINNNTELINKYHN